MSSRTTPEAAAKDLPGGSADSIDETRWQAVQRRDAAADGGFVYAVVTTGVYCRPSCASRAARRKNVRFFATGVEAARAGFRPCKRCRPDEVPLAERHALAVTDACRAITRAIEAGEAPPPLAVLADTARLSRHHFHRLFTATTGVTPRAYTAAARADALRTHLAAGGRVTDAIYAAGYGSSSRAYEAAAGRLGMTPLAFRDGGDAAVIHFATGQCSLGAILVATTVRGVCAIALGNEPKPLIEALRHRFSKATLVEMDPELANLVARVIRCVDDPLGDSGDLPLDVRGTAFQQRVWQALRQIPPGATTTYAELAVRIDRPGAARAVAGACAANPVAVVIPCHRVIRGDGGLGGYRWGIERKQALLKRERNDS